MNLTTTQCRALMDRDLAFKTSTGDMDSDLFIDILNEIEDVFFDIAIQADPTRFLTATAISTGTNPTTVATCYMLDVDGGGIFDANSDGTISNTLMLMTERGSSATGYWTESITSEGGIKVHFTPTTIGTNTKWIVFVPYRTLLTDGATTLFPSRKSHYLKHALLRAFYLWRENGMLNIQDAEFQNALRQMIDNSNPHKSGLSLNISSF